MSSISTVTTTDLLSMVPTDPSEYAVLANFLPEDLGKFLFGAIIHVGNPLIETVAMGQSSPTELHMGPGEWILVIEGDLVGVGGDVSTVEEDIAHIDVPEKTEFRLVDYYAIVTNNRRDVEDYLGSHPELTSHLIDASFKIPKYFGDDSESELLVTKEPESSTQSLYISISSHLSPENLVKSRIAFYVDWLRALPLPIRKLLNVSASPR